MSQSNTIPDAGKNILAFPASNVRNPDNSPDQSPAGGANVRNPGAGDSRVDDGLPLLTALFDGGRPVLVWDEGSEEERADIPLKRVALQRIVAQADHNAPGAPVYFSVQAADGLVWCVWREAPAASWETFLPAPTAALTQGATALLVYALAKPIAAAEAAGLAREMGCDLDVPVPLPGSNGWALEHLDPEALQTPADLVDVFGESEPAVPESAGATYLDARVLSPLDLDADELQEPMTISVGANFQSKKWRNETMSRAQFVALLARHPVGRQKDGPGFVLGEIVGDNRRKQAVKACWGIGLDIDVGMPGHEIDAALAELGCLAIRYTTFSHGKTVSKFNRDKIIKWCAKNGREFDADSVHQYLSEAVRWDPRILESAEYYGDVHEPEGVLACVRHAPMEKHRVVVPLLSPFIPSEAAPTHAEGMKLWADVCRGLAKVLGELPMDNSAVDPSRLFYFPRHADGKPHETTVHGGALFDWRSMDLGSTADAGDDFDRALAEFVDSNEKTKSKSQTPEGRELGRWSIKRASGFQIVDVIRDYAEDRIRTPGTSKIDLECPFDEDHSNPGDPEDRGCFAVNAGDGPSPVFTVKCQHDSCQGKTNLDFLGKMVKDEWFPRDVLDDETYNAVLDDEAEPSEAAVKIEREDAAEARRQEAKDSYQVALDALSPDSPDEQVNEAVRLVIAADLDARPFSRARDALSVRLKMGKRDVDRLLKEVRAGLAEDDDAAHVGEQFSDLAQDIPLPGRAYGNFTFRTFEGRPWVHAHDVRLWTPWAITGAVTYPDRDGIDGLKLKVQRVDGAVVEFDIPADLTTDSARLKGVLRQRGVALTSEGMERLTGLAAQASPDAPTKAYGWGGWREPGTFLTPWGTPVGDDQTLTVVTESRPKGAEVSGSYDAWRDGIDAAFETGLRQLQLSACAAYASPLIGLCPETLSSGMLFISGAAEAGKTTAHKLQVSAWGDPTPGLGLLQSLNVSAQAPEVLLTQASGAGGAFDEVKHYQGSFGQLAFNVSNNSGRSRMRQDTQGLREQRRWSGLYSTSYEKTLEHRIREEGKTVYGGLGARVLEVPADLTKLNRQVMSRVDQVKTNFGFGGTRFIQALFDQGYVEDPQQLSKRVEALADMLLQDTFTDQRRAARLMATTWAAGEIAQDAGLIPMEFPVEPPEELWAPTPENDARKKEPKTAPPALEGEALKQQKSFESLDSLGQMIVLAWRASRRMESASTDPVAKAVAALLRNLSMGRGVVDHGDTARADTHAVRLHDFDGTGEAVFVIPNADLPALLDGSADPGKVKKALRKAGLLKLRQRDRNGVSLEETTWGHIPGYGAGPAIVIPINAVTEEAPDDG